MSDDLDWKAALVRLETIVHELRRCHVAVGFKLDHEAAHRALGYLRRHAQNPPPADAVRETDEEGFEEFVAFMRGHGQSLDYVLMGRAESMAVMLAGHHYDARKDA